MMKSTKRQKRGKRKTNPVVDHQTDPRRRTCIDQSDLLFLQKENKHRGRIGKQIDCYGSSCFVPCSLTGKTSAYGINHIQVFSGEIRVVSNRQGDITQRGVTGQHESSVLVLKDRNTRKETKECEGKRGSS